MIIMNDHVAYVNSSGFQEKFKYVKIKKTQYYDWNKIKITKKSAI